MHPTTFATTGYNPTRRSLLSPAVPASAVDTDFTTEDPRAESLAARRPPTPLESAGDVVTLLRLRAKGFAPTAYVDAYIHDADTGIGGVSRLYCLRFHGPDLRPADEFTIKQPTAELALRVAKGRWPAARRATDTARLTDECRRLAGVAFLDEDVEQALETECKACSYGDFPSVAAKFRRAALTYAARQRAA